MNVLLPDIDLVKKLVVESVVTALDGVAAARVVLVDRKHLDIGEGDFAFLELSGEIAVEGNRGPACGKTEFERTRKRRFLVILDGFDNDVGHTVAADCSVVKNLGVDLLEGGENALRKVLLDQSTVLW